jgi:hypothetical protein
LQMYVYSAPDEPASVENKVICVPGGDRHVNIILVKTPSQDPSSQTEVIFILLEQDEHKNLVYVLLKKGESQSGVKITRPSTPRQQKLEAYFIRYGNQQGQARGQCNNNNQEQQRLQLSTGEETSTGTFHGCGRHLRKRTQQRQNPPPPEADPPPSSWGMSYVDDSFDF